jgi:hypothetical protein
MSVQRKRYSAELKARVALEAIRGQITANEIAAEYGVHPTQITQWKKQAQDGRRSLRSLHLFQRAAAAEECPPTIRDAGMHDAVFEILDVDHRRLVRFLPTDQEDPWPDGCDRNLNGLRGPSEGALSVGERHHRLRFEVEMVDPTPEIYFIYVADSWKGGSGHEQAVGGCRRLAPGV